ncbi:hypothetical protein [Rhodoferax sp.]|uniref:hypothetical protein n=1 Tax=Rhodoferax sp. TaxID=50421 RepID=UPI002600BA49|nr:hypothetical protein [Rhodoferax sp.]
MLPIESHGISSAVGQQLWARGQSLLRRLLGGMLSQRLACEIADTFRAIAAVAQAKGPGATVQLTAPATAENVLKALKN